jgi:hypothetical protein
LAYFEEKPFIFQSCDKIVRKPMVHAEGGAKPLPALHFQVIANECLGIFSLRLERPDGPVQTYLEVDYFCAAHSRASL